MRSACHGSRMSSTSTRRRRSRRGSTRTSPATSQSWRSPRSPSRRPGGWSAADPAIDSEFGASSRIVDGGLYGPGSEAWRLNRESMLLLGAGPRALLLQIAHPLVAEGVADHSDFQADPWSRLAGTLRSYLRIVYGTAEAARAEIRRLNQLHQDITGPRYRARDPDLSLWVHATLVDSTIAVYEAWIEPLSAERRARHYEETMPLGGAVGIPPHLLPGGIDPFEAHPGPVLGPPGPLLVGAMARERARAHPP